MSYLQLLVSEYLDVCQSLAQQGSYDEPPIRDSRVYLNTKKMLLEEELRSLMLPEHFSVLQKRVTVLACRRGSERAHVLASDVLMTLTELD